MKVIKTIWPNPHLYIIVITSAHTVGGLKLSPVLGGHKCSNVSNIQQLTFISDGPVDCGVSSNEIEKIKKIKKDHMAQFE